MEDNSTTEQGNQKVSMNTSKIDLQITIFQTIAWIFVILGLVILGCTVYGFLTSNQPNKDIFTALDELGSFLSGLVGSLWSLAGLFFVYVAFLGQQKQLVYNKEELEQTRDELAGQKEQMELQNATLKQQQFENTFFNLFKYHQDLLQNMAIKEKELYGIRLIQELYLNISRLGHKESTEIAIVNELNIRMKHHYYTSFIIPIVKSILQQLLLVDKKCSDDKDYYIQLIKSTLSNESIAFATYFSFLPEYSELKRLIIKYEFLNDFPTEKFKKDVQLMKEIRLIP